MGTWNLESKVIVENVRCHSNGIPTLACACQSITGGQFWQILPYEDKDCRKCLRKNGVEKLPAFDATIARETADCSCSYSWRRAASSSSLARCSAQSSSSSRWRRSVSTSRRYRAISWSSVPDNPPSDAGCSAARPALACGFVGPL